MEHKKSTRSQLFDAAVRGDLEAIRTLLSHGELPDDSSEPHYTPLQAAVALGHSDIALLLLRSGADLHFQDEDGFTALTHAIWSRRADLTSSFLKMSFPQTLRDAAGVGDFARVRQLVESGIPVNDDLAHGFSPLYFALMGKHVEVARYLLAHGAGPSRHGTVLKNAAEFGVTEIVQDQIAQNRELSASEISGAAWYAASGDYVDCLRLVLDCRTLSKDELSRILMRACVCCAASSISLLAERGADVNYQHNGNTPLHIAIEWANVDIVALLLELGADLRLRNADGETAFEFGIAMEDPELTNLLTKAVAQTE